ncbi:hypothetical protein FEM03_03865 [Phragmitibacter flavus]|uniref:Av71 muscle cell intermediate filament n=1 Tax=Phragmitibacter flavus TaxID=2576071 RepID=A0A5R8KII6_9BACT|nr:hypothetical protein FEM03_03865 [Phragmitibacter flavus]
MQSPPNVRSFRRDARRNCPEEPRTKNQEPRTKNQEPRTKNQEPRTRPYPPSSISFRNFAK